MKFNELLQTSNSSEASHVDIITHFAIDDENDLEKKIDLIKQPLFNEVVKKFSPLDWDLKELKLTEESFQIIFFEILHKTIKWMFEKSKRVRGGSLFIYYLKSDCNDGEYPGEIFRIEQFMNDKNTWDFNLLNKFIIEAENIVFIILLRNLIPLIKENDFMTFFNLSSKL